MSWQNAHGRWPRAINRGRALLLSFPGGDYEVGIRGLHAAYDRCIAALLGVNLSPVDAREQAALARTRRALVFCGTGSSSLRPRSADLQGPRAPVRWVVRMPGGSARFDPAAPTEIWWHAGARARPTEMRARVVGAALTQPLAVQGAIAVHAAGFELGGRGLIAVGDSGAGKSTLAAAAVALAGKVLSDDVIVIARIPAGHRAWTLRRHVYLRPGSVPLLAKMFPGRPDAVSQVGDRHVRVTLPPSCTTEVLSPAALWLTRVDPGIRRSRVEAASHSDAFAALAIGFGPLFLSAHFPAERSAATGVLSTLAATCPAFRVTLGADLIAHPAEELARLLRIAS